MKKNKTSELTNLLNVFKRKIFNSFEWFFKDPLCDHYLRKRKRTNRTNYKSELILGKAYRMMQLRNEIILSSLSYDFIDF